MRFADTSFWFGLQERRDQRHEQAQALVRRGVGRVVTTNHVLGETWTLVRRRSGHAAAVGFLDRLQALPDVQIVHLDEAIEREAWRWLRARGEREYSFVDATSFAVMRQRRIREALAFDGDFNAAGFVEVRAT
ncbi:MAG TPA: PIN domain-containing protein [Candidatus Dormibacteraeota bacterium]|nr:PIN domain-containing protein [Candidatus Dormibacteraeota bacterium]